MSALLPLLLSQSSSHADVVCIDAAAGTPNRGSATSSPALGSAGTTPVSSSAKAPLPKGTTSVAKLDFEVLRDKTRNACLRVIFTALELDAVLGE